MKLKTNLDLLFCLNPTFQKSNADPVSTEVCKSSIESFFTKSFQYVLQTIPTNILILLNITGLRIYLDANCRDMMQLQGNQSDLFLCEMSTCS